jgi:hypothetical protein
LEVVFAHPALQKYIAKADFAAGLDGVPLAKWNKNPDSWIDSTFMTGLK